MDELSFTILRHVGNEYQNLFLFVHFNSLTDTIELVFSEKNGKLLGRGIGDIREVKTLLDSGKTYFNSKNKIIKIEQAMRYGAQEKIKKLNSLMFYLIHIQYVLFEFFSTESMLKQTGLYCKP